MAPRRKPPHNKATPNKKSGAAALQISANGNKILKPSQRFIFAKSGKLSKTDLTALVTDPDTWASLTKAQQLRLLTHLKVKETFGPGHPAPSIEDDNHNAAEGEGQTGGGYMNYFTTPNPLATRVSPDPESSPPGTAKERVVPENGEVYFDMRPHCERFMEHLKEGRFAPAWQRSGEEASRRRGRGDWDGLWRLVGGEGEVRLDEESLGRVAEVARKRGVRKARGVE